MKIRKLMSFFAVFILSLSMMTACLRESTPPKGQTEAVHTDALTVTVDDTIADGDLVTDPEETDPYEDVVQTNPERETERSPDLQPGEYESGGYIIDEYAAGSAGMRKGEETRVLEMTRPQEESDAEPYSEPAAIESYTQPYTPSYTPSYTPPAPSKPAAGSYAPSVLMYHLILDEPTTSLTGLFVRPSEFDQHLTMLENEGYQFLFADEYEYTDGKSVIITLDDGYVDNYTEMYPILKRHGAKATIFVIAGKIGWEGYLSAEQIKEMSDSGLVSIQSHTVWHQALTGLSSDSLRSEFADSKSILEGITGRPVTALAYPAGRFDNRVKSVAAEYFSFAYTTVSSGSTAGYGTMELPRVRVARGQSASGLKSLMR